MQLAEAFRSGQATKVWELSQQLVKVARSAADEAAQARFKVNLGTDTCDNCEGLKAGVGVTATCFQLKRCFYDNVRGTELSSKQKTVIEGLMGHENRALANQPERS
jgi:hypothetical protein